MRGNESGIAWNVRERLRDAASTGTEIAIAWIENVADRVIASAGAGADRASASVGVAATDCRILISRKSNDHATEETAIATVIGIVRGVVHAAMIAIETEIVNETSGTGIAIAEIGRIVAIVRMKIQKKFELKKSLWMIIRIIAIRLQRRAHTLLQSSTRTIMIRRWRRNTGFQRVGPTRLRTTITIRYKIIDLSSTCFRRVPFFTVSHNRRIIVVLPLLLT